ncbi:MAG TPA: VTT domain-containing protein [Acetobacteraceae bacterium]|nr:VTT domain-containing protein [Acetobacteraceae bacterium]
MRPYKPLLLLLVLALLAVLLWRSGVLHALSWQAIARHELRLRGLVTAHPLLAPLTYAAIYAALVALSVPESALVTVLGGVLFGTLLGGLLAIFGSTVGAVIIFLAARSAFAAAMARRAGALMERVRAHLHRDGFSYLLALRLVPALPFWFVNLAAALCGMRLVPYAAATLIGIIPATFVLASVGAGVGDILASGAAPDVTVLFTPRVLIPLLALALLALLPALWRRLNKRDV